MKKDTSWDKSGEWYNNLIEEEGSYQKEIILPNLERLISFKLSLKILDLGCGTGFFARAWQKKGAVVIGVDNSKEMIAIAQKSDPIGNYHYGSADNLGMIKPKSVDAITIILALQNMEKLSAVLQECARVLIPGGSVYIVINHPCFRIPKASSWEWSPEKTTQFRRIDRYLSEAKLAIQMHPGLNPNDQTVSFHRPLQTYFKLLGKSGLAVTRLEEWISHRQGPKGKTFTALETARKEIPLFLFVQAIKIK
ncbi:MAG: hypothetical protein A2821_03340 [Candidatus Magasanikbacteria bacterium RIFCSPHIGHO2_01_FULL_41_23]|uniref:Methyltransferase type 11 domain-containing protein n=1 Tax=Candidatus Magasanikbacteria bacterium RIFCSPLOWO2_01_FULL_40_15 TaxID=1798686 RepID=A0A1F6N274_9BACT|nr:MAG: hypothetical protein A2821_03340 [Candidatus Magasanikbacteria bacterium RIFCSPHIGHO2_01_FULL_41_23]OGH76486.1 MAG: hypothetical protein A3F22_03330 [Candidatus Magasanikbacteria bacterium RIFCSPHIGHO2_12_FULL_41_16]OGH77972.1 MAG: hypothetical protein A2983_01365 [Candidatus Magasanikbacteria bacterium RIFCSPLOWO2_01_FULL_40_15]